MEIYNSQLSRKEIEEAIIDHNKQFSITGYFLSINGSISKGTENTRITDYIILNRDAPIELKDVTATTNGVGIHFFDVNYNFIGIPNEARELRHATVTIPPSSFPKNAVYFMACTEIDGSSYSNGISAESRENAVAKIGSDIKKSLFIDLWNQATGSHGKYNTKTGYFELNGLTDISYEQAICIILAGGINTSYPNDMFRNKQIRTNLISVITFINNSGNRTFDNCINLEIANVGDLHLGRSMFQNCSHLHTILSAFSLNVDTPNTQYSFSNCKSLQNLKLKVSMSFSISDSPLLSYDSIKYMIDNAANTSPITITVHPDVYAKLTDTTNTEWNAILNNAATKQISFVTA